MKSLLLFILLFSSVAFGADGDYLFKSSKNYFYYTPVEYDREQVKSDGYLALHGGCVEGDIGQMFLDIVMSLEGYNQFNNGRLVNYNYHHKVILIASYSRPCLVSHEEDCDGDDPNDCSIVCDEYGALKATGEKAIKLCSNGGRPDSGVSYR